MLSTEPLLADIVEAKKRTASIVKETPILESEYLTTF